MELFTKRSLKIVCIGAGYVGACTTSVMALKMEEHKVFSLKKFVIFDNNKNLIEAWNSFNSPIHENSLTDILKVVQGKNLFFSNTEEETFENADIIFFAVNTPFDFKTNKMDISNIIFISKKLSQYYNRTGRKNSLIIVEKSTVPLKTSLKIRKAFEKQCNLELSILSNPEFLSEGTAIKNLLNPDRVIIGGNLIKKGGKSIFDISAINLLKLIYLKWVPENKILTMSNFAAEMTKLASNAFLAQRISSINSLTALCENSGTNINEGFIFDKVAKGIGLDSRIGSSYLKCSFGFGGACLEKDTLTLAYLCETSGLQVEAEYWRQVIKLNNYQKHRFYLEIVGFVIKERRLEGYLSDFGKIKISIFGVTFKEGTDDVRNSPALSLIKSLCEKNIDIEIYDPHANKQKFYLELEMLGLNLLSKITFIDDIFSCVKNSQAIIVLTELSEF